ncbi:MAG: serine protein kinase, partial [bacterium]|nr:serine protein kinase [bacterium]
MSKITEFIADWQENKAYQELTWEGGFFDYLQIVEKNPKVSRSAFQRIYDMVLSYGYEEYTEYKKKIVHFKFFEDPIDKGKDALFGIDLPLMKLVNTFQAAARRYGPEKRIILLHGPVGGAKSTIVRLLKKGIEAYSRTPEGALYSFSWVKKGLDDTRNIFGSQEEITCPMHEEPLNLLPKELRQRVLDDINKGISEEEKIVVTNELCPSCRFIFRELNNRYHGDFKKVMEHVRVRRIVL